MTQIMQFLEISQILESEIIAKELDECNEILFVMDGKYDIGYEINKKIRYRKQFGDST
jgi:adenosine/AMP kinase